MNNLNISKTDLTLEELAILQTEMVKKKKNKEAAWGLWAGMSFFGAHRFYTEDYGYASAMLLTSMIPLIAIITIISTIEYYSPSAEIVLTLCALLLAGSVIWSWIDAFFLNKRIDQLNEQTENQILSSIREQRIAR